jgi:branched-chain amino acid transport system substrate-binding protein
LKTNPDFKTIAVVNQDYAWGRDSWEIFRNTLLTLKPDVKVVGEFFPKFGASDFSTEVSRLSALKPDVVLSTALGWRLGYFFSPSRTTWLIQAIEVCIASGRKLFRAFRCRPCLMV